MQTVKEAFQKLKTILRFVWRHALTIAYIHICISVFMQIHFINVKNSIMLMAGAVFIDWLKMKITAGHNVSYDQMMAHARAENDSNNFGSIAWRANPAAIGSPANYLNSVGTSSQYS